MIDYYLMVRPSRDSYKGKLILVAKKDVRTMFKQGFNMATEEDMNSISIELPMEELI